MALNTSHRPAGPVVPSNPVLAPVGGQPGSPLARLLIQGAFAAGLALGLSACGTRPEPAPVVTPPPTPSNVIFVSKGETIYDVAKRYNIPLRDLIEENRLQPPYTVVPGQRLVVPTPHTYVIKPGDTLYGVARTFNVDSNELARLNGLAPPYLLRVGQTLNLPYSGAAPAGGVAVAPAARPGASVPATSGGRGTVTVAPAGTGPVPPVTTAPRRAVESQELASPSASAPAATPAVPTGSTGATIPPGATVAPSARWAPATPGASSEPVAPSSVPSPAPAQTPPVQSSPAPASVPSSPGAVAAGPSVPPSSAVPTAPSPLPKGGARFLWPVTGQVISTHGAKPGGQYNDGINIAAPTGTPVVAADAGVVKYAGNQLRGFGNLVLIQHADGMVTAYAQLDQIMVEANARVARGQRIGTVGSTGNVTSPQLHFEVRQGNKVLDPMDVLDPGKGAR
ncbi:LysM peptidoglycan-binding domain-containing M23 family metallopeptidase [Nitrospirillum iridis]|uniref:Murein DD-endopeptidase MepM/ murein hydrolase activator NlpD n=1 Tax=Nitrospirillum iridis TaxID=765888 RepID=A0A7X0AWE2_9PROT|nr:LysM peptidoglycan-binding domain-containing M23 family metallopeptidase [Nitrospirillum iridis]MBB6251362.1 murein DD-endopeptidase MepM/ murein hydrolase activator NlpD [Nitrospirillum iridis]